MLLNEALGTRLRRLRIALGKNQAEMAQAVEMAQSNWSSVENGKLGITIDKLHILIHAVGVNPTWLFMGQEPMFLSQVGERSPMIGDLPLSYEAGGKVPPHMVELGILSTVAALGEPIENEDERVIDRAVILKKKVPHPSQTWGLRVRGDSMFPTLQEGFLVFVDRHPDALQPLSALDKKLVVVRLDHGAGGISIKRLVVSDNGLLITADHPAAAFKPVALPLAEAGRILAKVLGWWGEQ